jgi:hypothetical protein
MAIITWTHSSFHHALTERCGAVSLIVDMLTVSSRTRALDIAHLALELEQAHGIVDQQLLLDCGLCRAADIAPKLATPSRNFRLSMSLCSKNPTGISCGWLI